MSIPKKGSRSISVDGQAYRWRVRGKPSYRQATGESTLNVAVELADGPGACLVVSLPQLHPSSWDKTEAIPVRPSDVCFYVRQAIAQGWIPHKDGPTFNLAFAFQPMSTFEDLNQISWPDEFIVEYVGGDSERLLNRDGVGLTPPGDDPDGHGGIDAALPKKHPQNQLDCGRYVSFSELEAITTVDGEDLWRRP